jgi:hypothetical protein
MLVSNEINRFLMLVMFLRSILVIASALSLPLSLPADLIRAFNSLRSLSRRRMTSWVEVYFLALRLLLDMCQSIIIIQCNAS